MTPLTVVATAMVILLILSQLVVTGTFFERASLSVLSPLVGILILVATGQAFVIATGGIDLSVPAVITLVGAILLKVANQRNDRLGAALLVCLVACVVIGLVNGVLVEVFKLNALVVTLAVGQLITGYTYIYRGQVPGESSVPKNLENAATNGIGGISYVLIVSVVIGVLATFFLHRVVAGRRLVASSAAPGTAQLVGARASGYRILAYIIGSCAYGVGGVLAAGQIGTPDLTLGNPYLLSSVVAVVLGGAALTGGRVSPIATLLGAAFVIVLDYDLRVKGLDAGTRMIVQGAVLVLALSLTFVGGWLGKLRRPPPNDPAPSKNPPLSTTS